MKAQPPRRGVPSGTKKSSVSGGAWLAAALERPLIRARRGRRGAAALLRQAVEVLGDELSGAFWRRSWTSSDMGSGA